MNTQKVGRSRRATQYTEINIVVEIAGHPNGKDVPRWNSAKRALRNSTVAGCSVVSVMIEQGEVPTVVPCFGHSYLCEKDGCKGKIQPWSVHRYFGWHVTVRGIPTIENMGRYKLTEHAELDFCGIAEPHNRGAEPLTRIA